MMTIQKIKMPMQLVLMSKNVISSIADIEEITVTEDGLQGVDVKAKLWWKSLQNSI